MKWGLVPAWAKDRTWPMINAQAEGIQDKPTFWTPFRQQRCLIPATHFFEWKADGRGKQPYLIRTTDQPRFAFASLYDVHYDSADGDLYRFSIVTTEPNALTASIHNRMPVILRPELEAVWLDRSTSARELPMLLAPYPASRMEVFPVSQAVNQARYDSVGVIAQVIS